MLAGYLHQSGKIQIEAQETSSTGEATNNKGDIDAGFNLAIPDWDFNIVEGKGRPLIYCQALLAGLRQLNNGPLIWPRY